MFSNLKARWIEEKCLGTPASQTQIAQWQKSNGIELPNDLRDYFLEVNGTDRDGDNELFEFISLERLKRWDINEWPLSPGTPSNFNPQEWFIFADFMISCYAYAINLGGDPIQKGMIVGVGWLHHQVIASSFSEFIDMYLSESRLLHPGMPEPKPSV